jgi:hypothetical protein
MERPNRKEYIGKETRVQLIADLEIYIDHLEISNKNIINREKIAVASLKKMSSLLNTLEKKLLRW